MTKLSFVSWFAYRPATEEEKANKSYLVDNDGLINYSGAGYTELKQFGTVTLKECQEIYNKIKSQILKENEFVKSIKIDLSNYDTYTEKGIPITGDEERPNRMIGDKKIAKYFIDSNCLRIYKNDLPIYQNYDGEICNDEVALTDCLM